MRISPDGTVLLQVENDDILSNGSFAIPPGITSIGNWAFKDCISLQTIILHQGITSVGKGAFANCHSLQSITLPQGITSIGNAAFANCHSLQSITLPQGVTSIGDVTFARCHSLQSITLPPGITSIGNSAFSECNRLPSITLQPGITSIGYKAFAYCSSLQRITLPPEINSIGSRAFKDCHSLQTIILPPGITSIGYRTFEDCSSLQIITLPHGLTSIHYNAFDRCDSLHSIIIEGSDAHRERIKALLPKELQDKVPSANLMAQAYQALEEQLARIENTASLNPLHRHLNINATQKRLLPGILIEGQQQDTSKEYPLLPNELFQRMNGFIADSLPAYQQAKSLMQQQPLPKTQEALVTYRKTLEHIVNIALAMHAQQYPSDFEKHLYFLKRKGEFFTRTQQQPQAAAVKKLHQQLMHSYINTLPHNGRQFQEECRQAIQDARNALEQQRGWGLILNYLLLLATGLGGLVVLADVGYHYATGKHCSFFQTTTAKQLNILEDSLELPGQNQQCDIN